jgi:hypothetical protein
MNRINRMKETQIWRAANGWVVSKCAPEDVTPTVFVALAHSVQYY